MSSHSGSHKKKLPSKVFLVDDHPLVQEGLSRQINETEDLIVCGQASEVDEALQQIRELDPSVVVVDISLKGRNGIELIKGLRKESPGLPVLVLSMHDETLYAERSLRNGAKGYIMKEEAPDKILTAIRKVLSGEIYLSEAMSKQVLHQLVGTSPHARSNYTDRLGDRELEVFELLGQGRGTRQIAERLHLSVKTIEANRARIMEKLNLKNANELVHRAVQWIQGGGL